MLSTSKCWMVSGVLAVSLLFGCSGNPFQGGTVAVVNNEVITEKEFQQTLDRMLTVMRLNPEEVKKQPESPLYDMFKRITLQKLILNQLVAQEAERLNLSVSDKEVKAAYEKQVTEAGGEKSLMADLKKLGFTKNDFMQELREQLIRDKLVESVAGGKVSVTEAQAKAYYDAHSQEFDQQEKVKARHILISADPQQIKQDYAALKKNASPQEVEKYVEKTLAEKKQKAQRLYEQVKQHPEQFENVARQNSDDESTAKNGGDLGYFAQDVMVPSFSKAAFQTKPGQIHDGLVETPFGYHIIQVLDRKPPQKMTFADVKGKIVTFLENQRKNQVMQDWMEAKRQQAKITINPKYDPQKQDKQKESGANAPSSTKSEQSKAQ